MPDNKAIMSHRFLDPWHTGDQYETHQRQIRAKKGRNSRNGNYDVINRIPVSLGRCLQKDGGGQSDA